MLRAERPRSGQRNVVCHDRRAPRSRQRPRRDRGGGPGGAAAHARAAGARRGPRPRALPVLSRATSPDPARDRAHRRRRPGEPGWRVRVFPNLYPITDAHEVVVLSPDHDRTFARAVRRRRDRGVRRAARPGPRASRRRARLSPPRSSTRAAPPARRSRTRTRRSSRSTSCRPRSRPRSTGSSARPTTCSTTTSPTRATGSSCSPTVRSPCGARSRRRRPCSCGCATRTPARRFDDATDGEIAAIADGRRATRSPPLSRVVDAPAVQPRGAHGTALVHRDHAASRRARGIRAGDRRVREHDPARARRRVPRRDRPDERECRRSPAGDDYGPPGSPSVGSPGNLQGSRSLERLNGLGKDGGRDHRHSTICGRFVLHAGGNDRSTADATGDGQRATSWSRARMSSSSRR